jgi:hypothetical protein
MGETYVANGQLTQAGYSGLRGTETEVAALAARVGTLETFRTQLLLSSQTASNVANLSFTQLNNALYRVYLFEFDSVLPATDSTTLWLRLSSNGGSSYDAGASDYAHLVEAASTLSTAPAYHNSAGATQIAVTFSNDVGNAAGEEGVTGRLWLFKAPSAAQARVHFEFDYENPSGLLVQVAGRGRRNAAQDTDAVRFLFSSGNITSGTIRMYGLN